MLLESKAIPHFQEREGKGSGLVLFCALERLFVVVVAHGRHFFVDRPGLVGWMSVEVGQNR